MQVEVVTPEKILFSGTAELVEAPGIEGDIGVMPQHMPLMTLLREGTVRVHGQGDVLEFPVSGGLAQVDGEKFVLLAENSPLTTGN